MPTRIARYIRAEVDARRRTFSDFLILTRKKRDRIVPYARALEALNIPIEVSGAGAFGESAEVEALTVLLRALADPQDALSLVAVLRGPLFGISDPELFAFKQAGGWFSLFAGPTDDDQCGFAESPRIPNRDPGALRSPTRSRRCVSTGAGRVCCPRPRRSIASSSTPATSRWRRRRPAASRRATSCTPSIASARSSRRAAASPMRPTRSRPTARRRTKWSRFRSSLAAPTSSAS